MNWLFFIIPLINCFNSIMAYENAHYNLNDHAMYFCAAADTQFYPCLLRQIGAIHKYDFDSLVEIAVFDLGMTPQEKATLNSIEKVKVYVVEMTNPHLLTRYNVRSPNSLDKDRKARGWYAWKPVVIKQALDMFPYVLYMDSGISPTRSLKPIFEHIKREGCFLISCRHSIKGMTTNYVLQKFNLFAPENAFILDPKTHGLAAGLQGISHHLYDIYVKPIYQLSHEIRNFVDDGTAGHGFGSGRHDQTLFSILARKLNLRIVLEGELLNTRERISYSNFFVFKSNNKVPTENYIRYRKIAKR